MNFSWVSQRYGVVHSRAFCINGEIFLESYTKRDIELLIQPVYHKGAFNERKLTGQLEKAILWIWPTPGKQHLCTPLSFGGKVYSWQSWHYFTALFYNDTLQPPSDSIWWDEHLPDRGMLVWQMGFHSKDLEPHFVRLPVIPVDSWIIWKLKNFSTVYYGETLLNWDGSPSIAKKPFASRHGRQTSVPTFSF